MDVPFATTVNGRTARADRRVPLSALPIVVDRSIAPSRTGGATSTWSPRCSSRTPARVRAGASVTTSTVASSTACSSTAPARCSPGCRCTSSVRLRLWCPAGITAARWTVIAPVARIAPRRRVKDVWGLRRRPAPRTPDIFGRLNPLSQPGRERVSAPADTRRAPARARADVGDDTHPPGARPSLNQHSPRHQSATL